MFKILFNHFKTIKKCRKSLVEKKRSAKLFQNMPNPHAPS